MCEQLRPCCRAVVFAEPDAVLVRQNRGENERLVAFCAIIRNRSKRNVRCKYGANTDLAWVGRQGARCCGLTLRKVIGFAALVGIALELASSPWAYRPTSAPRMRCRGYILSILSHPSPTWTCRLACRHPDPTYRPVRETLSLHLVPVAVSQPIPVPGPAPS